jgi:hypothetical protein
MRQRITRSFSTKTDGYLWLSARLRKALRGDASNSNLLVVEKKTRWSREPGRRRGDSHAFKGVGCVSARGAKG